MPTCLQQVDRAQARLALVDVLVKLDDFGDLSTHRMHGRERRQRLLEDHGDLIAADSANHAAVGVKLGDVHFLTVRQAEHDRSVDDFAGSLGQEQHNRGSCDAFAAAGFADKAERLPRLDGEGHAVDRAHGAVQRVEVCLQIIDCEQR